MKLNIESKLPAAIAAASMTLTAVAMAQGHSKGRTGGPHNYGPTKNPGLTHMSQQGYHSSLPGRTNAEQNRQKFGDGNGRQQRVTRHDSRELQLDRRQTHR